MPHERLRSPPIALPERVGLVQMSEHLGDSRGEVRMRQLLPLRAGDKILDRLQVPTNRTVVDERERGALDQIHTPVLYWRRCNIGCVHYPGMFGVCPTIGSGIVSTNYDELAVRAERGYLTVKPGTVRRGTKAAADAQRLVMEATGATNADDLIAFVVRCVG